MAWTDVAGAADAGSIERVLSITDTDLDGRVHSVASRALTSFTWDYDSARAGLSKLYERAKSQQWNGRTDLPWETDVDQEAVVRANAERQGGPAVAIDVSGTPAARWGDRDWLQFGIESQNWTISQFLHGEQGALVCAAKIVGSVPSIDAKYFAATQVMDEARHVEVFSRYLDTKLSGSYPVNTQLQLLLDDVIADSRWDMTYLGMQVMVEGLALASFAFIQELTTEPLLRLLLDYVIADEARHMAFGVISLRDVYEELSEREVRDRQEFALEAVLGIRDRMQYDAGDGWLRRRFGELGVLQYEHQGDQTDLR